MIVLITGGQSSGKSEYAENYAKDYALKSNKQLVYVATARVLDEEFAHRVKIHKSRRGEEWINIEEEKYISRHDYSQKVVLIDCVTLWIMNHCQEEKDKEDVINELKSELDRIDTDNSIIIFVTNEIGLGGTSANKLQRMFTDIQGKINQYIASKSDEVYLVACGIPIRIK